MSKPHYSASSLGLFAKCAEAGRRRYLEGHKLRPPAAIVIGAAGHESVRRNLAARIDTGSLLPLEEVQQIARDALERRWPEVELSGGKYAKQRAHDEAVDKSVTAAWAHAKDHAPKLEPSGVEVGWTIEAPGWPWELIGYVDILEASRKTLRDTKISSRTPKPGAADDSLQLTLYAMAAAVGSLEIEAAVVALDHVTLYKRQFPRVVTQTTARGKEHFDGMLERIYRVDRMIEAGIFPPANPELNWYCSREWCGYWSTCPFAQKRPVSVGGSLVELEG